MLELYSAGDKCAGCKNIRRLLEENNIKFIEYNIAELSDKEIADLFVDIRLSGYPGVVALEAPILRNPSTGDTIPASCLHGANNEITSRIEEIL